MTSKRQAVIEAFGDVPLDANMWISFSRAGIWPRRLIRA
jgi:hypothetical protein